VLVQPAGVARDDLGDMIADIVPTFGSINMIGGECDPLRCSEQHAPNVQAERREIPFEPGDTIIRAAWRQGIEIPHYCWHPGLSVAANCRMCLVEVRAAARR
jgi:ferredoxin